MIILLLVNTIPKGIPLQTLMTQDLEGAVISPHDQIPVVLEFYSPWNYKNLTMLAE
jgi:hypothetical protein